MESNGESFRSFLINVQLVEKSYIQRFLVPKSIVFFTLCTANNH